MTSLPLAPSASRMPSSCVRWVTDTSVVLATTTMAATTAGCEWPVDVTAMPAAQSPHRTRARRARPLPCCAMDLLIGGTGADLYVIHEGDGNDTIFDQPQDISGDGADPNVINRDLSGELLKGRVPPQPEITRLAPAS